MYNQFQMNIQNATDVHKLSRKCDSESNLHPFTSNYIPKTFFKDKHSSFQKY